MIGLMMPSVFAELEENEMIVRNFTYDVPIMEKAWDWEECFEYYEEDCYRTTSEKFILSLKLPNTLYIDQMDFGISDNVNAEDFVLHQDDWETLHIVIGDEKNSSSTTIQHSESPGSFYLDNWNEKFITKQYGSPSCPTMYIGGQWNTDCNWFIVNDVYYSMNGKYPQINLEYEYSKGVEPFREIEYTSKVAIIFHNDGYWRISTDIVDAELYGDSNKSGIFELVTNNIKIFDQDDWEINLADIEEKMKINENSLDFDQDKHPDDIPGHSIIDSKVVTMNENDSTSCLPIREDELGSQKCLFTNTEYGFSFEYPKEHDLNLRDDESVDIVWVDPPIKHDIHKMYVHHQNLHFFSDTIIGKTFTVMVLDGSNVQGIDAEFFLDGVIQYTQNLICESFSQLPNLGNGECRIMTSEKKLTELESGAFIGDFKIKAEIYLLEHDSFFYMTHNARNTPTNSGDVLVIQEVVLDNKDYGDLYAAGDFAHMAKTIKTSHISDEDNLLDENTIFNEYGETPITPGGCLIATAAFGSEMAPQVQLLREIRDNTVMNTQSGTAFMTGFNQFYYSFSPYVADYERENPFFKEAVKVTLTPLLTSLTLLNYVDIDTEEEMLGYGIGIILLNIGMYFVAPAVLIVSLKKRLFL